MLSTCRYYVSDAPAKCWCCGTALHGRAIHGSETDRHYCSPYCLESYRFTLHLRSLPALGRIH